MLLSASAGPVLVVASQNSCVHLSDLVFQAVCRLRCAPACNSIHIVKLSLATTADRNFLSIMNISLNSDLT